MREHVGCALVWCVVRAWRCMVNARVPVIYTHTHTRNHIPHLDYARGSLLGWRAVRAAGRPAENHHTDD